MENKKYCLATVTDRYFLPGSLVLIHSFLHQNPWFDGDIVLIADRLENNYERYFRIFPNVSVHQISQELIDRTNFLCEQHEQFAHRRGQFYSLDLFRIKGYDKLLFLDSDILIRGSFRDLFERKEPLLSCGDNYYYRNMLRDHKTFGLHELKPGEQASDFWTNAFSAGMMLFDKSIIDANVFENIVKMVDTAHFDTVNTNHSDQLILNQYFKNQYTLVSSSYNYRFNVAEEILERDGATLENAAAIHLTAKKKAWDMVFAIRATYAIGETYRKTYRWWHEHWNDVLDQVQVMNLENVNAQ